MVLEARVWIVLALRHMEVYTLNSASVSCSYYFHLALVQLHALKILMAATSSRQNYLNPFTPPSSTDSAADILSPQFTLEEGLAKSQLRGMQSVNKKFGQVEQLYKDLHGEAASQQEAIDIVEASTLKTALLTGETTEELKKFKKAKDRKLRTRIFCVGIFLLILIIWLLLVVGVPRG